MDGDGGGDGDRGKGWGGGDGEGEGMHYRLFNALPLCLDNQKHGCLSV